MPLLQGLHTDNANFTTLL